MEAVVAPLKFVAFSLGMVLKLLYAPEQQGYQNIYGGPCQITFDFKVVSLV